MLRLSVVTVVFNDAPGLSRTLTSVRPHLDVVEHWVIDGSTTSDVRDLMATEADPRVKLLSEPDDGPFHAMNKGLDRASGDYVMFLNAGDVHVPTFDPERFVGDHKDPVLVGFVVERHEADRYLRPSRRHPDAAAKESPPHPATAYPRRTYTELRYLADVWNADGNYSRRSIDAAGYEFVPMVVAEFELGGASSSYGNLEVLRWRLKDAWSNKERARVLTKAVLWRVLPRRAFYGLLALRKYERIGDPALVQAELDRSRG